jgi:hypothetical protein
MQFPRIIYHATLGNKRVEDQEQHEAYMKAGWQDPPIAPAEPREPEPEPDPVAILTARLEELTARVDALESPRKRK